MQFKRYELKYYLHPLDAEKLAACLSESLQPDPFMQDAVGYRVRSLYFDSYDDECLYQKLSGFLTRKKIRLRTYGDWGTDTVKFEIKHKQDALVFKESCVIDKAVAQLVVAGNWLPLLHSNHAVLQRIYATFSSRLYRPKVLVDYIRQAYSFPAFNLRITIDKYLHSNIQHLDLFSSQHDAMPVVLEGKQILEVKYEQTIPDFITDLLSSVAAERQAISKYTLARRFYKQSNWEDN